ncbi:MAG: hypothetical protein NC078_06080 [Ruminococcus sp.]|nr:hypothetical protein [Ruminococcus sp.]
MVSLVYDLAVLLIFLICIRRGYKRGALRTALGVVCIALSYIIASAVSSYTVCSGIYEKYFRETVYEHINEAVQNAKEETAKKIKSETEAAADKFIDDNFKGDPDVKDFADRLFEEGEKLFDEISPEIYSFFDNHKETLLTNPTISDKIESVVDFYSKEAAREINARLPLGITVGEETLKGLITSGEAADAFMYELFGNDEQGGKKGVAEYIERQAAAPVFIRLIGAVLWSVGFAVSGFVLRIAVRMILTVRAISPVRACDSVLGGVLGAAAGAAVTAVICVVTVLAVQLTGGMTYMNEEIIGGSLIFGKIYGLVSAGLPLSA